MIKKHYQELKSYLALLIGMLLVFFSMASGLLGTIWLCELLLDQLYSLGILVIMPKTAAKISLWIGATLGLGFFGFLGVKWVKSWRVWKNPTHNE